MRLFLLAFLVAVPSWGQIEVKDPEEVRPLPQVKGVGAPDTGKPAADKYIENTPRASSAPTNYSSGSRDHYMAVHLGYGIDSTAYEWGDKAKVDDPARLEGGVTYRIGEWINSMDLLFRAELMSFKLYEDEEKPVKLSVMPIVTFPDSNSRFPLYFGAGLGLGVFFKQLEEESALSIDLQLLAGVRFFEVFENTGFFIETGLKNHLHLLSDGQLNAVYFSGGAIFTF
ncbi:MAG: hypothetical protein KDD25_05630 [Bdellovibrionales bacterium]|nr:hypothetical protein [Bdellovibrionales bacterium]